MNEYINLGITIISSFVTTILGAILTHHFTIKSIDYEKYLDMTQKNKSVNQLLSEAEKYYKMGEINKVFEIYNLDIMATDPIALSNLAYLYENGEFVSKNIRKAKDLYNKAYTLGNIQAVDNWIKFNIKYPPVLHIFVQNLIKAKDLGSSIPAEFIGEYLGNKALAEKAVEGLKTLNDSALFEFFSNRMYEEELNDGLKDIIAPEFVLSNNQMVKQVKFLMDTYQCNKNTKINNDLFRTCIQSIPLYGNRIISDLGYRKYSFVYAWKHPTQFIFM